MCSSCNGTVIARKWWVQTLRWRDTSSEMSPAPSVLAQRVATFRRPADARQKKKERPTIQLGHIFHLASRSPCPEFPSSTWVNGDWRAILRRRLVDSRKIDSGRIREIWWEKQPSWKVGGEKKKAVNTWHKGEETTGENHNRDEDVQSFPTASSASIRSFQSQRIVIVCACRIITGNGWCQLGADKRRYKRERVSLYYRVCLNHRRMRNERRPSFPQRNTWLAPIDIPHHRI